MGEKYSERKSGFARAPLYERREQAKLHPTSFRHEHSENVLHNLYPALALSSTYGFSLPQKEIIYIYSLFLVPLQDFLLKTEQGGI